MNKNASKKRKKKQFYRQFSKKQKFGILEPGVLGILITCNKNEKQCVREAYNILNEYGDKLFGPELLEVNTEDSKDVESELELELQFLKNKTRKRFQQVDTKVPSCLFIKTEISNPSQLVSNIFEDIQKSQIQKTRYILRMLPILVTCKAYLENIEKSIVDLLGKFTSDSTEQTFSIIVKIRHNNSIGREAIVSSIYRQISNLKPKWKADLKSFKLAVVVEILNTVCCLGIVKDYIQFRKYNLAEITNSSTKPSIESSKEEKDETELFSESDVKPDVPTRAESLETELPSESDAKSLEAELPSESGAKSLEAELPSESGAKSLEAELPSESDAKSLEAELPESDAKSLEAELPSESDAKSLEAELPSESDVKPDVPTDTKSLEKAADSN